MVSSSWYLKPEDIPPELKEVMKFNNAIGGSFIVNPAGLIIKGPVFEPETIVHAKIDLSERELAKVYVDGVGHYSRQDLLTMNIRDEAWLLTGPQKLEGAGLNDERAQRILDLMERYNIIPYELEAILDIHLKASE